VPSSEKSNIKNQISNITQTVQSEAISNVLPILYIYPNPFTKQAMIRYTVPVAGRVTLKLYNTVGQMINTLIDEYQNTGSYTLNIDNCKLDISKGVYFLKYETTTNSKEIKLIVE
jgi:hypothetical protein